MNDSKFHYFETLRVLKALSSSCPCYQTVVRFSKDTTKSSRLVISSWKLWHQKTAWSSSSKAVLRMDYGVIYGIFGPSSCDLMAGARSLCPTIQPSLAHFIQCQSAAMQQNLTSHEKNAWTPHRYSIWQGGKNKNRNPIDEFFLEAPVSMLFPMLTGAYKCTSDYMRKSKSSCIVQLQ